jgi:hypothetical protein
MTPSRTRPPVGPRQVVPTHCLRAHPLEVVGHRPALPAIPNPLIGVSAVASSMSTQAQAGGGARIARSRSPQAGSVPRIARRRAACQGSRAGGGRKINLAVWCPVALKKKKEKGRFGVGAGLRGQILDRPPILRGSVGPSKAPLAYRPTSSRPSQQGHRSVSDRVPTLRGVEPVEMRSGVRGSPPTRGSTRLPIGPTRGPRSRCCVAATEEEQRCPGTHTEVRPGVVV